MRQYIAIRFRPHDRRTYTYHWDGAPVRVGDTVKVPGKHADDGWTALPVVDVTTAKPAFTTKAILGVVDGQAVDDKLCAAPPVEPHKPDLFGDC